MPRIAFTLETDVPAERVMAAITDFSDRRPELWPGISRRLWKLHAQGHHWAECTEGTDMPGGGVWARERYEWSEDRVVATVQESNVFRSGTWEMSVEPLPDGGCRVHVVNDRRPKGKGRLVALPMMLFGRRILAAHFQKTLDILRSS
jgi:hypothetical protein